MWPGTSDTWLKAAFFAGLWAVAATVVAYSGAALIMLAAGGGDLLALLVTVVGFPLIAITCGAMAYLVHESKRVVAIMAFVCIVEYSWLLFTVWPWL